MSLTADSFEQIIKERLHADLVQVEDMSGGCGQAFAVVIVSDDFKGKNKLARHRMVNSALKQEIESIHAFTQKGYTREEWEKEGGSL
ncbi:bolA-like protein 2 [Diutina catenulata]